MESAWKTREADTLPEPMLDDPSPRRGKKASGNPISAEYNSDDARIIELKSQGNTDQEVAQVLREERRVNYAPKTISSRYSRLKKVIAMAEEEKMDEERSDWHEDEDDNLQASYLMVSERYARRIEKLQTEIWEEVASSLAERLKKKKFTAKSCKERLDALEAGTAVPPIEQDPYPEARRVMREAAIAEKKRRRAEGIDRKKAHGAEKKHLAAKKKAEIMNKTQAKKQRNHDQAKMKQLQTEKRAGREMVRQGREKLKAKLAGERRRKREEVDAVEAYYRHLTGFEIPDSRQKRLHASRDSVPRQENRRVIKLSAVIDPEEEGGYGAEERRTYTDQSVEEGLFVTDNSDDDQSSLRFENLGRTRSIPRPTLAQDAFLNPRSIMTVDELDYLLVQRGLPCSTLREPHFEIVARLAAADEALDLPSLNDVMGLPPDSQLIPREEKIYQLQDGDAMLSEAGRHGVKSTDHWFQRKYEREMDEWAEGCSD